MAAGDIHRRGQAGRIIFSDDAEHVSSGRHVKSQVRVHNLDGFPNTASLVYNLRRQAANIQMLQLVVKHMHDMAALVFCTHHREG